MHKMLSRLSISSVGNNFAVVLLLLVLLFGTTTVVAFNGNHFQQFCYTSTDTFFQHGCIRLFRTRSRNNNRINVKSYSNNNNHRYTGSTRPIDRIVLHNSDSIVDNTKTTTSTSKATDDHDDDIDIQLLQEMLQTAKNAAIAAGSVIIKNLGCAASILNIDETNVDCDPNVEECIVKTTIKDIVTQYDTQAQSIIQSIIQNKYPNHLFLGEEDVNAGPVASEDALIQKLQQSNTNFLWITDPIDGTANFASGLSLCAVTICIVYNNEPLIGVIYDPHTKELFHAIRNNGSYLTVYNDEGNVKSCKRLDLRNSSVINIKDAIINAGCPADTNAFITSIKGVTALNNYCRGIRMIACSALTTAWIASNRLTAHYGYDLSCWDLIAGALIIIEANGIVTDIDGSPYTLTTRNMVCSNGNANVHDSIIQILKDADAISFQRSVT
jgi:myo-inositol-1(or 4)-monophosphatase